MSATAQNFVYEIKTSKDKPIKEQMVSKELLDLCKKVAEKYPLKK
jgi:hypothetical protein